MKRLLIVDDEYEIRTGIASYFPWKALGIEVGATCRDGLEALEALAESSYDFVLCDVRMPRMDGIRFAEVARERNYRCDIVFISAYKDFEYAKRAISLGVKNYIVKPAGYEELREVFSRLVAEATAADLARAAAARGDGPGAARDAAGTAPLGPDPDAMRDAALSLAGRLGLLFEADLAGITLPTAARALGMSPNYLSSRLHKETGRTFTRLLLEARMDRAKELLADRSVRVREVSALVGYASAKSFIRAFKSFHGGSPREFRGPPRA